MAALERDLPVLREGLPMLRRMDTDLDDAALDALNAANGVLQFYWPQLLPLAPPAALHEAARAVREHVTSERPWEGIAELRAQIQAIQQHYRECRQNTLQGHSARVEAAVDSIKLGGRLITTVAELERLVEEIKRQISHQLQANHRVRLR